MNDIAFRGDVRCGSARLAVVLGFSLNFIASLSAAPSKRARVYIRQVNEKFIYFFKVDCYCCKHIGHVNIIRRQRRELSACGRRRKRNSWKKRKTKKTRDKRSAIWIVGRSNILDCIYILHFALLFIWVWVPQLQYAVLVAGWLGNDKVCLQIV